MNSRGHVTIKDIKAIWPDADVQQVASKQLFIVQLTNIRILVSYKTIVGKYTYSPDHGYYVWLLSRYKYSSTTSKQLSQFSRGQDVMFTDEPISISNY